MSKEAEWRKRVEDWKKVLNEPKNLGLKAGGTGISEAIRKVADAEMDFAKAFEKKKEIVAAYNDLNKAAGDLINLCTKTIDKHKKLFITACNFLATVKTAAEHRRSEAAKEVDEARKGVTEVCLEADKQLKNAKDISGLAAHWLIFVMEYEMAGKAYPTLKTAISKIKEVPEPTGDLQLARPKYLKLVEACKNAVGAR